jgi:hypothetical protein
MHANIVFETIKLEPALQNLFKSSDLRISCVWEVLAAIYLGYINIFSTDKQSNPRIKRLI